jgi:hypothetical protein
MNPNDLMVAAAENGDLITLKFCFDELEVDIHAGDDESLRLAAINGHTHVVEYLNGVTKTI